MRYLPSNPWDENYADTRLTLVNQQMLMPNGHGMLFANPVPESASIPRHEMETMIAEALKAADAAGATGSSNTPFVLRKLQELSKGRTNKANQALIESNVVRGATLAKHYEKLLETGYGTPMPTSTVHQPAQNRQKLNSEWRKCALPHDGIIRSLLSNCI